MAETREMLRKPGQLSCISASECCSSFQHLLQQAVYTCLVCGWKARTLSLPCEESPRSHVPVSEKVPFVHSNLSSCGCSAPVWKRSALVVDSDACLGSVLKAFAKPCCVSVVLRAFVASLWESRPVIMPWKLQAFICFFFALKV